MLKKIHTDQAPKPVGHYSQAIAFQSLLFISGQIPLDPITGKIEDQTIEGQTKKVLDHIEAILQEANVDFSHLLRVEIYLQDLNDAPKVNAIYASRLGIGNLPARQMMQVARLPGDSLIEISCIARIF